MKTLEELKKEIHYVYTAAAEAMNYKDFQYMLGAFETVGEILEGIINKLISLEEKENEIEQLKTKIQQLEEKIEDIECDVGSTQSALINKHIM